MSSPGSGSDAVRPCSSVSQGVLCCSSCSLISSHPHGSRQRSCHWFCCIPNFCKLLGATFFHSGLSFRVLPQCEDTCEFWGYFRGVWIPWGTAFPALSSTFATVGLPTNDQGGSILSNATAHITLETQLLSTPYGFPRC